jgi:hypothetical protein
MRYRGRDHLTGAGVDAMVQSWGQQSRIKSIQRGTITMAAASISQTATITAVAMENSVLLWGGTQSDSGGAADTNCVRLTFTNSTTITANCNANSLNDRLIAYQVIEYHPGVIRSIQRGTISTSSPTDTATITAVDMNKSQVFGLGWTTSTAGTAPATGMASWSLTNATTVTFASIASHSRVVGYQVTEFY